MLAEYKDDCRVRTDKSFEKIYIRWLPMHKHIILLDKITKFIFGKIINNIL